jgi:imidazolonepropionase-like amidohydrolase
MKSWPAALAFALLCTSPEEVSVDLCIDHVTVIDGTGGAPLPDHSVAIRGNRIASIEPSEDSTIQANRRIDGQGGYVVPGLWDMHVHLQAVDRPCVPLFLAYGVTSVRDMGSDLDWIQDLEADIEDENIPGPTIYYAGPILDDAPEGFLARLPIRNADDGRAAVRELADAGVHFLKVYSRLSRASYYAIVDEARKHDLTFAGHLPGSISFEEAIEAGQTTIEHLDEMNLLVDLSSKHAELEAGTIPYQQVLTTYDTDKADRLFSLCKERGIWHAPTVVGLRSIVEMPETYGKDHELDEFVSASMREFWQVMHSFVQPQFATPLFAVRRQMVGKAVQVIRRMHSKGVGLLAGTDVPLHHILPGYSLHDELLILAEAGLTSYEVLQTATLNPAKVLECEEDVGTLAAGKVADLVLLTQNPLSNLRNSRSIRGVFCRGLWYDRDDLDDLLENAKEDIQLDAETYQNKWQLDR